MKRNRIQDLKLLFRRLFHRRIVIVGAILVLVFILAAIFAEYIAPYNPYKIDIRNSLASASSEHLFGTDENGRDVFSRVLFGARTSLLIGLVAVLFSAVAGILIGLISGYVGGIVDMVLSRIMDAIMAIPNVLLALALGLVMGNSIGALMFILGISTVPTYARIMRGQVLTIRNADYVMAETVIGANPRRIALRHILPNCISPMIVLITQNIGNTILSEATLSFVGLGVNPPTASWGGMVNDGYIYLLSNPVYALAPGVCIMLLVFGFNVLGDGLRDVLDPRLRGTLVK